MPFVLWPAQRGHLFPWVPVMLGCGIGFYFTLPVEPPRGALIAAAAVGVLLVVAGVRRLGREGPLLVALGLVAAGFALAGGRAHMVEAPVLGFRFYGPIEGRVVAIDRSLSDKTRLTLDRVILGDLAPRETPARIRVSLHGRQEWLTPLPGVRVMMTGHVMPPQAPAEPGGFDFRRHAWFAQLGGVGYTRTPVLLAAPGRQDWAMRLYRLRLDISRAVQERLPGRPGSFAAAILTGDRSSLDRGTVDDLRKTNLAHLLAISGLHMGLLSGIVFGAIRFAIALWPYLALRLNGKKIAAAGAWGAAAAYLAISGASVATERAFVMVSVMLLAVMLDRRALSLRAVALAALVVLLLRPESVLGPGFQMSFAATTALIAVFAALRQARDRRMGGAASDGAASGGAGPGEDGAPGVRGGWHPPAALTAAARPILALLISSFVAGVATAPIAAAHFNIQAQYGLIANLISVPVMGLVIMPGAVLAAGLSPLGADGLGLFFMEGGIAWVLGVASRIAQWEGTVNHIRAPPAAVLPALALGGLLGALWQGWGRALALPVVVAALVVWAQSSRPRLLVSESGALLGLMTPAGRSLSAPRSEGFVARSWLENDGDGAAQMIAGRRAGLRRDGPRITLEVAGRRIVRLAGKRGRAQLAEVCATADLVILSGAQAEHIPPDGGRGDGACRLLGPRDLRVSGALAIEATADGLRLRGARQAAGRRLWSGASTRRTWQGGAAPGAVAALWRALNRSGSDPPDGPAP
ncbi:ComEC/Rec2 family competence protein [Brevirhabdus sp.]|uniref:ComEC/Rec2 family competence protein n=1 Tax=Brevirhabdus sp. TaxID=2004514 RepID=UPI004057ECF2